eukprot:1184696-Prorocentrum_minimum.AAC.1
MWVSYLKGYPLALNDSAAVIVKRRPAVALWNRCRVRLMDGGLARRSGQIVPVAAIHRQAVSAGARSYHRGGVWGSYD